MTQLPDLPTLTARINAAQYRAMTLRSARARVTSALSILDEIPADPGDLVLTQLRSELTAAAERLDATASAADRAAERAGDDARTSYDAQGQVLVGEVTERTGDTFLARVARPDGEDSDEVELLIRLVATEDRSRVAVGVPFVWMLPPPGLDPEAALLASSVRILPYPTLTQSQVLAAGAWADRLASDLGWEQHLSWRFEPSTPEHLTLPWGSYSAALRDAYDYAADNPHPDPDPAQA